MKKEIRKIISDGWKLFCKDINSAKWAIIFIIAYFVILKYYFHTVCPVVLFTGFPCPACGLTRAGFRVLHLDFIGAFKIHPFIYPIIVLGILFIIERYFLQKKNLTLSKRCAICIIVSMIVFYIWRMVRYFPDIPPMTYYNGNIITRISRLLLIIFR